MFYAMLGSLFTVLTILLIVQSSRSASCSDNPGKLRSKSNSFESQYSKALRELVLDNVLISKTARQQNRQAEVIQYEGIQTLNRERYNQVYGACHLPASKSAADGMGRPVYAGNSFSLHYGAGINNKY